MRLVQIIAVLLLLVGFAGRPTVATAMTDGHFISGATLSMILQQPHFDIPVLTSLENGVDLDEPHCSPAKCIAGVLPPPGPAIPRLPTAQAVQTTVSTISLKLAYARLRPPRALPRLA